MPSNDLTRRAAFYGLGDNTNLCEVLLALYCSVQFSSVYWFHAAVTWQNERTNM